MPDYHAITGVAGDESTAAAVQSTDTNNTEKGLVVRTSRGTAGAPMRVDPTGSTVQPVSGTVSTTLSTAAVVGQAKIASTGTAVQLSAGALNNGVIISAASGNNAAGVTIGGSGVTNTVNGTGNGYILAPGASVSFAVDNVNRLYINGTTGDIVSWAGS